jgi:hypothetical protein
MHTTITPEMLKGLKFRTPMMGKKEVNGEVKIVPVAPGEVDMLPEHVASAVDKGDHYLLVSKDGMKHRVPKRAAKKEEKKEDKKTA